MSLSLKTLSKDVSAGLVVFLVALPLCLGIALASNAPLMSGILSGIVGGLVVALLSGSHTSVSGPAAGLTAIVFTQIAALGSFQTFLVAVVIAGALQLVFGALRGGFIAAFFPSSVIKGLLAAIGIILILKQFPHAIGHDPDPVGEMSFRQPDGSTTFGEFIQSLLSFQTGAMVVGLASLALLIVWDKTRLKKLLVPAPLVAVLLGIGLNYLLRKIGGVWTIETSHLVQIPVPENVAGFLSVLNFPDLSQGLNLNILKAAVAIAIVASLETLLNLEAVDKLDPRRRVSPPNRELMAQGTGNIIAGLIGGLPVTSVIVRSSVNINAGAATKLSAFIHGALLFLSVIFLPQLLNQIPLAALAAILLTTGFKLASPALFKKMWREGRSQFLPFITTIVAIVATDLLIGIVIGLAVSLVFILHSNFRRPLRRVMEHHIGGDVLRIELANQVSFLNRATLANTFDHVPNGSQVLLDARQTDYIDPDILDQIQDFRDATASARNLRVSMVGFKKHYAAIDDHVQYVDVATRDIQSVLTPASVLRLLKEGNRRFVSGERLSRDLMRQVDETSKAQFPMAVVLSCMDSRTSTELIFDLGLGDIFSVRVGGNVASESALASLEYACAVAGAKLVVVLGHTRCGAVGAAVDLHQKGGDPCAVTGCAHIQALTDYLEKAIEIDLAQNREKPASREILVDRVARQNVRTTMDSVRERSSTVRSLVERGQVAIVGGLYDVRSGKVEFMEDTFQYAHGSEHMIDSPSEKPLEPMIDLHL